MAKTETYNLTNKNKLELQVNTLGATILDLKIPDKNAIQVPVVVGLSKIEDYSSDLYLKTGLCLGSSVGRYAGRISKGQFTIDSKTYPIFNKNGVHLHGGNVGFDRKIWSVEHIEYGDSPLITMSYFSRHLEEGYPGNLKVFVTYNLTKDNALKINYTATTDQTTIINLTNHAYFNLNGGASILDHKLQVNSQYYLDVDDNLIPTGKINPVKETPYDFNTISLIGRENFKGFDDTFVLNDNTLKAVLTSEKTGIQMKVYTNQPAIVIYTPPKFQELPFKDQAVYSNFPAICFETQHYPDAPNNGHFPSTILKPNETYSNASTFEFSII